MTNMKFKIEGMHCKSCEHTIKSLLKETKGIKDFKVSFEHSSLELNLDNKSHLNHIKKILDQKGYTLSEIEDNQNTKDANHNETNTHRSNISDYINIGLVIIGIISVLVIFNSLSNIFEIPQINSDISYGLLFIVGLLTGFHCVAMCGGFVLSYSLKHNEETPSSKYLPHLFYGSGKLISYTFFGVIFGLIGATIAFTPKIRGTIGIISGIFLIIFGLSFFIDYFKKFRLNIPGINKLYTNKTVSKNPFLIGLFNGLMIVCGPLQAIYLLAAGSADPIKGGIMLFIFGLGTLPVMLGFGLIASSLSSITKSRIIKISGIIVLILGLIMINRGLTLMGTGISINDLTTNSGNDNTILNSGNTITSNQNLEIAKVENGFQTIRMDVVSSGWKPDTFILKKDVPVRWIINGKEITGCNNAIQVPSYNLEFKIKEGEQTIEFTPKETGTIKWSCWMGMIQGRFIVKENLNNITTNELESVKDTQLNNAGTCSMGGSNSGCDCGMMK